MTWALLKHPYVQSTQTLTSITNVTVSSSRLTTINESASVAWRPSKKHFKKSFTVWNSHYCLQFSVLWSFFALNIVLTCYTQTANITFWIYKNTYITVRLCWSVPLCLFHSVCPDSHDSWCYFLLWWVCDSLVLIPAVTPALCCFSSGRKRPYVIRSWVYIQCRQPFLYFTCLCMLAGFYHLSNAWWHFFAYLPICLVSFKTLVYVTDMCCSFFLVFSASSCSCKIVIVSYSIIPPQLSFFFYVQQCFTVTDFLQNVSSKCQLPLKK